MSNLSEFKEIKRAVAKAIVSDRKCVDLITNTNGTVPLPAAELIETPTAFNQVHMYDYIPGVTEEAKVHVCVEVYDLAPSSVAVGNYELAIYCVVPESLMVMDGAIRRDEIVAAIDDVMNNKAGSWFGSMERASGKCAELAHGLRGRLIRYNVQSWNNHGDTLNADR